MFCGAVSLKSCKNAPFVSAFLSAYPRLKLLDLFSLVMFKVRECFCAPY
jgi:hypothetical protein